MSKTTRIEDVGEEEKEEAEVLDPEILLMKILSREKVPISEEVLLEKIQEKGVTISSRMFERIIHELDEKGYDIKIIYSQEEKLYSLIRYSKHNEEAYYRVLGKITTPFMVTSDLHIGCRTWTEQGYEALLKDLDEYSIKDVVMPGDILQGRGVHSQEAMDVKLWNISDQMDEAVSKLNEMPKDVRKHTIMGGHEGAIKGSVMVGLDVLRAISSRVNKMFYYGSVAKLSVDEDYSIMFLHSSGGQPYAVSYRSQRLWEGLVERPNILAIGHLHQLYAIPRPRFNLLAMAGTLQRENSYLINRGIIAQVGWLIVEKFSKGVQKVLFRIPEVY